MYNIYTDKQEIFECAIKLQGASLRNSKARLVIESDEYNLIFFGEIDDKGNCTIPIKKVRSVLPEGLTGTMKLEVIAEDTYFTPWTSPFTVKISKSVQVEVKSQNTNNNSTKPIHEEKKVTVTNVKNTNKQPVDQKKIKPVTKISQAKQLAELLKKNNITFNQLKTDKKVQLVLNNFMKESKITNKIEFLREVKNYLK